MERRCAFGPRPRVDADQDLRDQVEKTGMLKSQFALTKVIRLVSSVPPFGLEGADPQEWSDWSWDAETRLDALAQAGNDLHGPGTHWVERELRFPGEDRSRTRPRMFEIRIAWRFSGDPEDLVRGSTPWWPDLVVTRRSLEMFLTATCDGCPDATHWLERRVA